MALIRFRQSSLSNSLNKERATGLNSRKTRLSVDGVCSNSITPSQPGRSRHPGIVSSVGEPTRSKMILAWLRSLSPVKMGFCLNISPKTQPTPHMSIAVVYLRSCKRSSGGRYHRVTTKVVYSRVASPPPRPGLGGSSS